MIGDPPSLSAFFEIWRRNRGEFLRHEGGIGPGSARLTYEAAAGHAGAFATRLREAGIAKGERVMLAYAAGNRDPDAFEDPETVRVDRFPNKHVGFGAGMHRCLGSFLARLMFQVMVTEMLNRLPDYRVIEEDCVPYPSVSKVNGWITIPAVFTPGKKVGAVIA